MSSTSTCVICGGGNGRLEKLGPTSIKTLVDSSLCKNDGLHRQLQVAVSVHRNCRISYSSKTSIASRTQSSDQFNAPGSVTLLPSLPLQQSSSNDSHPVNGHTQPKERPLTECAPAAVSPLLLTNSIAVATHYDRLRMICLHNGFVLSETTATAGEENDGFFDAVSLGLLELGLVRTVAELRHSASVELDANRQFYQHLFVADDRDNDDADKKLATAGPRQQQQSSSTYDDVVQMTECGRAGATEVTVAAMAGALDVVIRVVSTDVDSLGNITARQRCFSAGVTRNDLVVNVAYNSEERRYLALTRPPLDDDLVESPASRSVEPRDLEDSVLHGGRRRLTENGSLIGSVHSVANGVLGLPLPEAHMRSCVFPPDEKSSKQTTGVRQAVLPDAPSTTDESCHIEAIDGTTASCDQCSPNSQCSCCQKENISNCVQSSRSGHQFVGLKRSSEPEAIDIDTRLADDVVTPAGDVTRQNSSSAEIIDGVIGYLLAAERRLTDVAMIERELRKRLATIAESEMNCYVMFMARAAQYFMPGQMCAVSEMSVAAANSNFGSAVPVAISTVDEVECCARASDEKENSLTIKSEVPDHVIVSDHQVQFKSEISDDKPVLVQSSIMHAGGAEQLDLGRGTTPKRTLDAFCVGRNTCSIGNSTAVELERVGHGISTPGQLAQRSDESVELGVYYSSEKPTSNCSSGDAAETCLSEPMMSCCHTEKNQFQDCNVCCAIFPRADSLTSPKRGHPGAKPFKCDFCEASFTWLSGYQLHIRRHSAGDKPYKCTVCESSFYELEALRIHKRSHTGDKPFSCDICGSSFAASSNLVAHKRCHTGDKPFHCNICGSSFTRADGLRTHKRRHNGEKPFKCDICGSSFVSSSALNDHKRRHVGEKSYKCSMCKSSFRELEALQAHKRSHTAGEDPFKCDICDSIFTSSSNLVAHKRCHIGEKQFHCTICGSIFARADSLRVHKRRHTGEKPFKCDICGSSFVSSSALCDHKRRHSDEKPFKCNVCGSSFAWPSGYRRHMRLHTGEKPYTCSLCGFSFACSSGFRRHMRRHTAGEKPHKCDLCELSFASVEARLVHRRSHIEVKPFKCDICGLSFTQYCNLSVHRLRHTGAGGGGGAKTFTCKMLGLSYAWPSSYRTHSRPQTVGKVLKIRKRVAVAKSNGKATPRGVVRKPSRFYYDDERRDKTDDYFSCATRDETEDKAPVQKLVSGAESGNCDLQHFLTEGYILFVRQHKRSTPSTPSSTTTAAPDILTLDTDPPWSN